MSILNEQVAYKRGVAGPKKWRPELIIAKMAVQLRLRLPLVFWTQALSHSLRGIYKHIFTCKWTCEQITLI